MSASAAAYDVTDIVGAQRAGKGGCAIFDSGTAYSVSVHPQASGFMPLTDTVFSAFTGRPNAFKETDAGLANRPNFYNYSGTVLASLTFKAGVYYPGTFNAATITSGIIIIYF